MTTLHSVRQLLGRTSGRLSTTMNLSSACNGFELVGLAKVNNHQEVRRIEHRPKTKQTLDAATTPVRHRNRHAQFGAVGLGYGDRSSHLHRFARLDAELLRDRPGFLRAT